MYLAHARQSIVISLNREFAFTMYIMNLCPSMSVVLKGGANSGLDVLTNQSNLISRRGASKRLALKHSCQSVKSRSTATECKIMFGDH